MGFLEALDRSVGPLAAGLDRRSRRHAALAANVANADTPGYRAIDVPFAAALAQAASTLLLAATDARHLQGPVSAGQDSVILSGGAPRRDGNDVDVDREMGKLARNQIEYQFLSRALSRRFGRLREAITGRATA
ncbi:MAG: flagellar basal body rod protein FlgB [Deltaproteobacteria bacterium]|nr:flagellar basal body rod protein FlgB [Deltaproteobacteria bacterium]